MTNSGVVLRKLREINGLTTKQASSLIGRSTGWLNNIENGKGRARMKPKEFERLIELYRGEPYRKQFGIWIAKAQMQETKPTEIDFHGCVLKYLRKKAKKALREVAAEVSLSSAYLSEIENGNRRASTELRNKLLKSYGYSPSSFKNFTTEDKRAGNIQVRSKLRVLLRRLPDDDVAEVFEFAIKKVAAPVQEGASK